MAFPLRQLWRNYQEVSAKNAKGIPGSRGPAGINQRPSAHPETPT